MHRTRLLVLVALLAAALGFLALSLARRGSGGGPRRDAPQAPAGAADRATPAAALARASRARREADLEGLRPVMTAEGMARLLRDLDAWRARLADPTSGPSLLARLPPPEGDAARDTLRRALAGGDPAALWRFYCAVVPAAEPPAAPPAEPAQGERIEADLAAPGGERRRVVLLRGADGWRIDRLQP